MDRDRELITFLKAKFEGIEARFEGIDARFDGIDARFDGIEGRLDGHDRRFDEIEEQNRHTHVVLESMRSKVELLAEGHEAQDGEMRLETVVA